MQTKADNIHLVSRRWNHILMGLVAGFPAVAFAYATATSELERDGIGEIFVILTLAVVSAFTTLYSLIKTIRPTEIELVPDGIILLLITKNIFVPWSSYKGVRGGPNFYIKIQDGTEKPLRIALGLWPGNLELTISQYAKKHSVEVPLRYEPTETVSAAPRMIIAACFLVFGIIWAIMAP